MTTPDPASKKVEIGLETSLLHAAVRRSPKPNDLERQAAADGSGGVSGVINRASTEIYRRLTSPTRHRSIKDPYPKVINGMTSAEAWRQGRIHEAPRLIPAKGAYPLDAQRTFRGIIVIFIMAAVGIGIVLTMVLINRISNRTVVAAPTANVIGVATDIKVTDEQLSQFVIGLVQRMETWNYSTVRELPDHFLQFFNPELHTKIKETYGDMAAKAQGLWDHRICAPLGVLMGGNDNGIRTIAVFFDALSVVGMEDKDKHISQREGKVAMMRVIQDQPSTLNPLGIRVINHELETEEHWIKVLGRPDHWAGFRKTELEKTAEKKAAEAAMKKGNK